MTLSVFSSSAQDSKLKVKVEDSSKIKSTSTKVEPIIIKLNNPENDKPNNWPWIAAIIVGCITFSATITAALINRKTTLKSLDLSKEIAIEQIKSSKSSSLYQFNSTLKSKNRQDWINNVRDTLSSLTSDATKLNAELQDKSENNKQVVKDLHGKFAYSIVQLELLLNPKKEIHEKLLVEIRRLIKIMDTHIVNFRNSKTNYDNVAFIKSLYDVVDQGRELLYLEWQKIQKLMEEDNESGDL